MQRKKKQTKNLNYKVVIWMSGSILLLILCVLAWKMISYHQARSEYKAIHTGAIKKSGIASMPSEGDLHMFEPDPRLIGQKDINADIVGWIEIPDTHIDYPVVQTDNNDYYMNHTFLGTENPAGAIFMEMQNQNDFSDLVTFVYGHRMKDESMFGDLKYYGDREYWEEHPEIHVYTYQENLVYEVFSVHRADVSENTFRLFFKAGEEYDAYLKEEKELSFYDTGVEVGSEDKVLVLVTCTADVKSERIVVLGKLKSPVNE